MDQWMNIAFIIAHKRNDVVVLFGTLKMQSLMLTGWFADCRHIFYCSQKKKNVKRKKQSAQIIKTRSQAYT